MNFSEGLMAYQTDAGPVIYPNLSQPRDWIVEKFWLAFCAFNQLDWIHRAETDAGWLRHCSEPLFGDCVDRQLREYGDCHRLSDDRAFSEYAQHIEDHSQPDSRP